MKNFKDYYNILNEAEPGEEQIAMPDSGQVEQDNEPKSIIAPPVPPEREKPENPQVEQEKDDNEKQKKLKEKNKKEKIKKKYLQARQDLIAKYTEENKDASWIVLKAAKNTDDAVIPLFTIDISNDPYLDKRKFELGKIEKKIDDQLDYNDIFVKDMEHMARKLGIENIIWKTDSHGSKYFKIQLGF